MYIGLQWLKKLFTFLRQSEEEEITLYKQSARGVHFFVLLAVVSIVYLDFTRRKKCTKFGDVSSIYDIVLAGKYSLIEAYVRFWVRIWPQAQCCDIQ